MQSLHTTATVSPTANKVAAPSRSRLIVRAQHNDGAIGKAARVLLSGGLAMSLALTPVANASTLDQKREEREQAVLSQMQKLEYALQQQENARKADLLGRRQTLENRVEQVEVAIERKLVEEAANEQAAAAKGDAARAERIAIEAERIKEQEEAVKVAAAKAEAQIARAQLVEQAKEVEEKQQVEKAATSILDLLGISEADLGLATTK